MPKGLARFRAWHFSLCNFAAFRTLWNFGFHLRRRKVSSAEVGVGRVRLVGRRGAIVDGSLVAVLRRRVRRAAGRRLPRHGLWGLVEYGLAGDRSAAGA